MAHWTTVNERDGEGVSAPRDGGSAGASIDAPLDEARDDETGPDRDGVPDEDATTTTGRDDATDESEDRADQADADEAAVESDADTADADTADAEADVPDISDIVGLEPSWAAPDAADLKEAAGSTDVDEPDPSASPGEEPADETDISANASPSATQSDATLGTDTADTPAETITPDTTLGTDTADTPADAITPDATLGTDTADTPAETITAVASAATTAVGADDPTGPIAGEGTVPDAPPLDATQPIDVIPGAAGAPSSGPAGSTSTPPADATVPIEVPAGAAGTPADVTRAMDALPGPTTPAADATQVIDAVPLSTESPAMAAAATTGPARAADVADVADSVAAPDTDATPGEPAGPPAPGAVPPAPDAAPGAGSGGALKILALVVGSVVVLFLGAWALDTARTSGRVVRNTTLGTTPIGGLDADGLDELFDELDADLAAAPVTVTVDGQSIETDAAALGARIDRETTAEQALAAGRDSSIVARPFAWFGTFTGGQTIEPSYLVDGDQAAEAVATVLADELPEPIEPELAFDGATLSVTESSSGTTVDVDDLTTALAEELTGNAPFAFDVEPVAIDPARTDAELQTVVDEANDATAEPIEVRVLDQTAEIQPNLLRSWVTVANGDELGWAIDPDAASDELEALFPALGAEDQQARFNVIDGEPIVVPAAETVICCDPDSIAELADALTEPWPPPADAETDADEAVDDDPEAEPELRLVELEPITVAPDAGVEELEALGIIEEVASFTTNHSCCEPRVTNIHRIADLMEGVVIRPGERFSVNDFIGRRTTDNGFVAAPSIINGILEPSVGGGISQFATTLFNAWFFAGGDFIEYQSHSLYISRYPRGREATISFPAPDLEIHNTTEYGILVWPTYTDTSITVTLYSTDHIEVEALDLLRSTVGAACTRYTTPRIRTYPDGTVVEDSVFATYRPGEGFDCAGNSTRPEEDEDEPEGPTAPQPDGTVTDEEGPGETPPDGGVDDGAPPGG